MFSSFNFYLLILLLNLSSSRIFFGSYFILAPFLRKDFSKVVSHFSDMCSVPLLSLNLPLGLFCYSKFPELLTPPSSKWNPWKITGQLSTIS
jgi:hypothetical protein